MISAAAIGCEERQFMSVLWPAQLGTTPLHHAAVNGHEYVARYLVCHGADVEATSNVSGAVAVLRMRCCNVVR